MTLTECPLRRDEMKDSRRPDAYPNGEDCAPAPIRNDPKG